MTHSHGMEPYSPSFHVPDVGARASIVGTLEVVPGDEWGAFGFPDACRDWRVTDISGPRYDIGQTLP